MKEFGINDVFDLICRSGGRMRYRDIAAEFDMDSTSMKLRNCLVKLRKKGLVQYIPAQAAWELTEDGRRKAGL